MEVTNQVDGRLSGSGDARRTGGRERRLEAEAAAAVLVTDGSGRCLGASAGVTDAIGFTGEELSGAAITDLLEGTVVSGWSGAGAELPARGPVRLRRRDGTAIAMDAIVTAIEGVGDERLHVVALHGVGDGLETVTTPRSIEPHRALFEVLGQGVLAHDAGGVIVDANPAAERILGRARAEMRGRTIGELGWEIRREDGELLGEDELPAVVALRSGAPATARLVEVRPPGGARGRWVLASAFPHVDPVTYEVIGAFSLFGDLAGADRWEDELRESHHLLERLHESNIIGVLVAEEARVIAANDLFLDIIGYSRAELEAGNISWRDFTPEEYQSLSERAIAQLLEVGACQPFEKVYRRIDGSQVPVLVGAARLATDPLRWVAYVVDLTEQKRTEAERERLLGAEREARADARRSSGTLRTLLRSSEVLADTLHYPEALDRLARLMVAELADICLIDVVEPSGELRRMVERHRLEGWAPTTGGLAPFVELVIERSRPALLASTDAPDGRPAPEVEAISVLRSLGPASLITVPLVARDEVLGAMILLRTVGARPYGRDDLTLATEIGRRAGVRLLNARLFDERDGAARTLQRRLLPSALPVIPGVSLAALHAASGEGNDVGGDFYDAFRLQDGAWLVAIGDVCGKGPVAAAMAGMARHTLRGLARHQHDPALLLEELNAALVEDNPDGRFCTVCLLRIDAIPTGARVGVANSGHPPPLVARRGGAVEGVDALGLLLGLFARAQPGVATVELAEGDTIVLYTDGVIERRGGALDDGEHWLRTILAEVATSPVDELVPLLDEAVTGRPPGTGDDDIAIVAVRVVSAPG